MVFLMGPRQVGKTTLSLLLKDMAANFYYMNYDILEDRQLILEGPKHVWEFIGGNVARSGMTIIVFDEIHKYSKWKIFLKGFFDSYGDKVKIIVTGSTRLDVYQAGGDSLMGRYLLYLICPLSVAELVNRISVEQEIIAPSKIEDKSFDNLWNYGGFPELFLSSSPKLVLRLQTQKKSLLLYEDIRELSQIHELAQLEVLAKLIKSQVGCLVNRSELGKKINVATSTIGRWIATLESFYYCFSVPPWSKNISRSLIKEPKLYLWDWSLVTENIGSKAENFIACHLFKAVHCWNNQGLGEYGLYYLRTKDKIEVDFVVVKNGEPWFLVEVKQSPSQGLSKSLYYFQAETKAKHAFQVVIDMEYIDVDCFKYLEPIIVPAKTFLSQLV